MGAAMGWTVYDVKRSSMWEFFAAWAGHIEANSPKEQSKLSAEEADALFGWIDGDTEGQRVFSTMTYWLDGERLVPKDQVTFTV